MPGTTPPELLAAYEACEDMAQQMAPYCVKKLNQLGMNQDDTLIAVWKGLVHKDWFNAQQTLWVMRRASQILEWGVPKALDWPPEWRTLGQAAEAQSDVLTKPSDAAPSKEIP
jgi:hypothetical protein